MIFAAIAAAFSFLSARLKEPSSMAGIPLLVDGIARLFHSDWAGGAEAVFGALAMIIKEVKGQA